MKRVLMASLSSVVLIACSESAPPVLPGYIEVEYTQIAAPIAGRLIQLSVAKGVEVKAGMPLFVLESDSEQASLDEARALLQGSEAQAADLAKGKRKDEIAVLEAQQSAVLARLALAKSDLQRQSGLARSGFISSASLDALQARVRTEESQAQEIKAQIDVARLAARADARSAAEAAIVAAKARLAQSRWRVTQKNVLAPVSAHVDDTLYRLGEWVPAGSPVVSLQEAAAIKVRFFVSQSQLSQFQPGQKLRVSCDGCQPFAATVNFVAKSAEFTPPVIYSKESRSQLVFLVEAKPQAGAILSPGQPVDVLRDGAL